MRSDLVTSVTSKGQVTIPAEVRRHMGIQPGDRVAFHIDNGAVRVERVKWTLETIYGSVPPAQRPENWSRRIAEAKREHLLDERQSES